MRKRRLLSQADAVQAGMPAKSDKLRFNTERRSGGGLRGGGVWRIGGPGGSRTPDLRFRKPLLYPAELRNRAEIPYHIHKAG